MTYDAGPTTRPGFENVDRIFITSIGTGVQLAWQKLTLTPSISYTCSTETGATDYVNHGLQISAPVKRGWSAFAAYTYSDARGGASVHVNSARIGLRWKF